MKDKTAFRVISALFAVYVLVVVAIFGGAIFVAWHLIEKTW